jgi:hypothetical protein
MPNEVIVFGTYAVAFSVIGVLAAILLFRMRAAPVPLARKRPAHVAVPRWRFRHY